MAVSTACERQWLQRAVLRLKSEHPACEKSPRLGDADVVREVPASVHSFRLGYTIRTGRLFVVSDDPQAKKAKPFGDGFHTSSPGGPLEARPQRRRPRNCTPQWLGGDNSVVPGFSPGCASVRRRPHSVKL